MSSGVSASDEALERGSSSGRIGRTQQLLAVAIDDLGLELDRIGPDREARRPLLRRRRLRTTMRASSAITPSSSASSGLMSSSAISAGRRAAATAGSARRAIASRSAGGAVAVARAAAGRRACGSISIARPARGSAAAAPARGRRSLRPRCRPGRTAAPGRTPGRRRRRRSARCACGRSTIGCTVKPSMLRLGCSACSAVPASSRAASQHGGAAPQVERHAADVGSCG